MGSRERSSNTLQYAAWQAPSPRKNCARRRWLSHRTVKSARCRMRRGHQRQAFRRREYVGIDITSDI